MKPITAYEVWIEKGGDNFKGWNNVLIATFKSEKQADEFAKRTYGWVEPNTTLYHPDFKFDDVTA